jgi:hypothetical protein
MDGVPAPVPLLATLFATLETYRPALAVTVV